MNVKRAEFEFYQLHKKKNNCSEKVKRDFLKMSVSVKKTVSKILQRTIEPLDDHKNEKKTLGG